MNAYYPIPYTKAILDAEGCGVPGCNHNRSVIYFRGQCHPFSKVEVCYEKDSENIVITCGRCHKFIAKVQVAD
jgi:hypothetical protein